MASKTPLSIVCDENENTVYKLTKFKKKKRKTLELSNNEDFREINRTPGFNKLKKRDANVSKVRKSLHKDFRKNEEEGEWNKVISENTSITAISDSHDTLLETTSPELTVRSSLKKQGKRRHVILSSDSDSEDFVKKSVGRAPRFNKFKKCDAHVTKVRKSLHKDFRKNEDEGERSKVISENTSITAVSDSHDNLLETTSPELTVHSSLKKQGKKRHIIVSSDSDSEDNEKESVGCTPGFNKLKKRDAHVTKVRKSLHKDFRKNEEEGEWNKVISEKDSEGGGDSIFVRELGGTSDNNCNGAALISSSQKKRSTRSNSTCQNNGTAASAEKLKKSKALEELAERRSSKKGARLRLSSNLVDDVDNKGSLHELEDQAEEEEEGQKEREEDENDLSDFIVEDSSQSQELDVTSLRKLSQEECFEIYLRMILSGVVNDEFLSSLEEDKVPHFEQAKTTIQGLIQTKKNAVMGKWKQYKKLLEDCTIIESIPLPEIIKNAECEACHLNRHLSEIIVFYDEENGEKVNPPIKEFTVGCFCAERGHIYHELHHLDFEWKKDCIEKVKAANPGLQDDVEIVEHCMSDEEWLEGLYRRFQILFGVAEDYGPGGKKRRAMKRYCSGFWED